MKLSAVMLGVVACLSAPMALARTCALSIDSDDRMQFSQSQLRVAADCTQVELTLRHTGKLSAAAMGHNWVLTRSADFQAVANAGMRAKLTDSYLPPKDPRVLAFTPVIGGGQATSVRFATARLRKGETYTFFCSVPGHWAMMKGTLVFA